MAAEALYNSHDDDMLSDDMLVLFVVGVQQCYSSVWSDGVAWLANVSFLRLRGQAVSRLASVNDSGI